MNDLEKEIIKEIEKYQTVFVYGDWGIGKTHFVRNVLYEDLIKNEENLALYIDGRLFDYHQNVFDIIALFCEKNKSNKAKLNDLIKSGSHHFINSIIFSNNLFFKTNLNYKKKDNKLELATSITKIDKKLIVIIDELDRSTPSTIIKILNFTNALSALNKEVKIIVVGNKQELDSILDKQFSINKANGPSKSSFLRKYFEECIDINSLTFEYISEVLNDYFWDERIKKLGIKTSARKIEQLLKAYKLTKKQYSKHFSDSVFQIAFLGEIAKNIKIQRYPSDSGLFFLKNGERIDWLLIDFYYKKENQNYRINDTSIEELFDNFKLSKFKLWIKKWSKNIP